MWFDTGYYTNLIMNIILQETVHAWASGLVILAQCLNSLHCVLWFPVHSYREHVHAHNQVGVIVNMQLFVNTCIVYEVKIASQTERGHMQTESE